MKAIQVRPTGVERKLGDDELIVTKTDPRGVLTYANDIFLRLSALHEDETIGRPHNIIRHPDMPRAIFKLLWEALGRRQEVFAYVVNLATDGAHYWVLAHVTPSTDAQGRLVGYHSSRRRRSPARSPRSARSTPSCAPKNAGTTTRPPGSTPPGPGSRASWPRAARRTTSSSGP